ncbi:hypothetical protein Efla_001340 [Eimeria flavescens]
MMVVLLATGGVSLHKASFAQGTGICLEFPAGVREFETTTIGKDFRIRERIEELRRKATGTGSAAAGNTTSQSVGCGCAGSSWSSVNEMAISSSDSEGCAWVAEGGEGSETWADEAPAGDAEGAACRWHVARAVPQRGSAARVAGRQSRDADTADVNRSLGSSTAGGVGSGSVRAAAVRALRPRLRIREEMLEGKLGSDFPVSGITLVGYSETCF